MAKLQTFTERVAQILEERLANRTWAVGELLPTEADLAAEFACSRGTVSKALARLGQLGLVERRTKVGTRVIAARRKFLTTATALQLDACAIVFPNEDHESIWAIVQGFQQSARQINRRTVLLSTGTDFRKEAEIVGRLGEFDVKGAVLYPVIGSPRDEIYFSEMILACPYPLVLADISLPGLGRSSVTVDHFHAGFTLTQHFLAQGHRRIGFLSTNSWAGPARERYLGFQVAMEQAGVAIDPALVLKHPTMTVDFAHPTAEGAALARKLLRDSAGFDAIICAHAFLGLGCWQATQEPEFAAQGLAVGSIGGLEEISRRKLPITTYEIDFRSIGQEAFRLLQRSIDNPALPSEEIKVRGVLQPAGQSFATG